MGRRALTAQEKAERQRQRQEALHAKQTLRLVREHALDPHLRVIVDRALPISSASQTIAATIGLYDQIDRTRTKITVLWIRQREKGTQLQRLLNCQVVRGHRPYSETKDPTVRR
ncbi:hypothetical protein FoTM2_017842 [Fusarium oxysporum f. sp. vasinfectum]|nr:hypothetical protein FoTM2_017842 [Fusarium oxysporum f. sp. vasinfectum]